MEQIKHFRTEIDKIDNEIIDLLVKRKNLCKYVGVIKKNNNIEIAHPNRENEIIERLINNSSLPSELITSIYRAIFNISKKIQNEQNIKN